MRWCVGLSSGERMEAKQPARRLRSAYIVKPWYDWLFFLGPPAAALLLGWWVSTSRAANEPFLWSEQNVTPSGLLLGVFIHAHLVIVFFRSHANRKVLLEHPYRFSLVPACVLVGMMISPWVTVICSVLATFWDVYHSGAQTFGFGRIYDAKAGNDALGGRKLDFAVNQLLYAGPIVAGATMMDHFEDFYEFRSVKSVFFTNVPAFMENNQAIFAKAVVAGGVALVAFYLFYNFKLYREGRNVSWQKVWLLSSTGVVSVFTWGYNTWGEAFLIMNFFHALQYFGIVWASEHRNMRKMFRLEKLRVGKFVTWALFVSMAFAYGTCVEAFGDGRSELWWSMTIVVSLMHFWYDGFIWSVRKAKS